MVTLPKLNSIALYIYIYIYILNALSVLGFLDFSCLYALPIWGFLNNLLLYISMHFTFPYMCLCVLLDSVYIDVFPLYGFAIHL